jgi:hypothetical protein
MTPLARSAHSHELPSVRKSARLEGGASFWWSRGKLRVASFILLGAALPGALGFALSGPVGKWLWLPWLLGIAALMHALSQRARADTVVLSIDERGILDRRLMAKRIAWQEIAAVCPVNIDRSHVVDLALRRPEITLADTQWLVRVGAHCQRGYGVPAVTISLVLLDGDVCEVLEAVATYRPELLHGTSRG